MLFLIGAGMGVSGMCVAIGAAATDSKWASIAALSLMFGGLVAMFAGG